MAETNTRDLVEEAREVFGWAILAMPPSYGMPERATFDGAKRIDGLFRALADEVERLRRGEFICQRCHHRKDAEFEQGDF